MSVFSWDLNHPSFNTMAVAPDTCSHTSMAELTMSDHFVVCKSLKNLSKEDIQRLGEALGLSYTKLQNMNLFPDEMVAAWLKRQDDVLRTGKPTWRTLVDALREIDQNGIAEDILTERIYHHGSSDKSHRQQTMASKLEQELSKDNDSETSEETREDLYQRITTDVKKMKFKFSSLQNCIRKSITDTPGLVKLVLGMNILSEDDEEKVRNTPNEVDTILTKYWSFLDYENFEHIVENMCEENEKGLMKEYTKEVKMFCNRRISELPPDFLGNGASNDGGMKKICVVLNLDDPALKRIKDLKIVIANILECRASQLVLQDIKCGSVLVTFLLTASVGARIFRKSLSDKQKASLKEEHVVSLMYESTMFFSEKDTQSKGYSPSMIVTAKATGRQLGAGFYGSVEEVEVDGVIYAGKRIHKELISANNVGIESIDWHKCKILSDLNHKNIVKFVGVYFLDDCPFPVLMMERLAGSLHDLLLTVPNILLPLKVSILVDVADGLLYLHHFNPQIVHRDLTAKNVLLTVSLKAKITDVANNHIIKLSLAQSLPENSEMQLYMPPEASKPSSHYSPSYDVFSFGHLALFVGLQVFPDKLRPKTYPDVHQPTKLLQFSEVKRRRVYFEQVERLLPNGKSHPLLGITKNCLQDVPSQRPTAQELVTELERMMINTAIYFGPIVTRQDAVKQVVTLWKQEMMNSKAKELEILQQQMDQIMFKTQEEITQVMIENLQSKEKEIQSLHQDLATLRDIISLQEIDKELQSQQDNLSKMMSAINLKSWTPKFKVNEQPYYFHYQGYNINWKECLGHGLYGDVYKAECDLLPCAAKVLERHPDSSKISAMLDEKRFLLNSIRHPNIVQYLDIVVDSEHASNALVLLMELLDESLTQMLEPSRQSLALHTQLNICHDIALAISYLHSKNIIHRDLSSNNVLLNAGKKAKVADFCMFGVYATNGANTVPVLTSLNVHLRTPDYMPPEALEEPPRYKKKLDCYSEGVIMMQICTHQKEPIREERRSHLEQIDSSHPLLPLIKKCLSDHEDDRPSAADLCYILTELKKQYSDVRVRLPTTLHVGAQQISEDSGTSNSDTPENSISSLPLIMVEGGDHTPRSDYPRLATQTATMLEQLWYTGAPIPSRLMVRGAVVSNIYEAYFMNSSGEIWLYDSSDQHPWSIVNNNYGRSRQYSSIAIVSGILTVIGGLDDQGLANTISNTLLSLMEDDDDTKEWKEHFPPMSTARYFAAAVTTSQHLIVAGGIGEERLSRFLPQNLTKDVNLRNVEVMNTDTLVWSTVASLPHPYRKMSATACGDKLYLLGGEDTKAKTLSVLICSVTVLIESNKDSAGVWKKLENDAPNFYCTGANLNGDLIIVGGEATSGKKTSVKNEVYKYDSDRGTWNLITNLPTARSKCLVAMFPSEKMVVVGGLENSKKLCTATEIWQFGYNLPMLF